MTRVGECLMFVSYGALLVLLAVPMALGKLGPNGAYGFRTPKTLASRELWFAANRIAGRDLILAGSAGIVVALSGLLVDLPRWLHVVVLVLGPCAACAHSWWAVRKL